MYMHVYVVAHLSIITVKCSVPVMVLFGYFPGSIQYYADLIRSPNLNVSYLTSVALPQ